MTIGDKVVFKDVTAWPPRAAFIGLGVVCFVLARWAYLKGDYENYVAQAEAVRAAVAAQSDASAFRRANERIWSLAGSSAEKQCYVLDALRDDGRVDWIPVIVIDAAQNARTSAAGSCIGKLRDMLLSKHMSAQAARWQLFPDAAGHLLQREVAAGDPLYSYLVELTPPGTEGMIYIGDAGSPSAHTFVMSNIDRSDVPNGDETVQIVKPLNVNAEAIPPDRAIGEAIGIFGQYAKVTLTSKPVFIADRFAWCRARLLQQPQIVVAPETNGT
ncbi:MAG TPA: hypothetical protein VHS78_17780 [Candidatus Elarobacter sp.]|nr:hypothetical protein [Candidatus Elarobacter sp.]